MKTIVITGTSRGIGYELVRLFAESGHYVFALSRNPQPILDLNLENVESLSCDLTDEKLIRNRASDSSKEVKD